MLPFLPGWHALSPGVTKGRTGVEDATPFHTYLRKADSMTHDEQVSIVEQFQKFVSSISSEGYVLNITPYNISVSKDLTFHFNGAEVYTICSFGERPAQLSTDSARLLNMITFLSSMAVESAPTVDDALLVHNSIFNELLTITLLVRNRVIMSHNAPGLIYNHLVGKSMPSIQDAKHAFMRNAASVFVTNLLNNSLLGFEQRVDAIKERGNGDYIQAALFSLQEHARLNKLPFGGS